LFSVFGNFLYLCAGAVLAYPFNIYVFQKTMTLLAIRIVEYRLFSFLPLPILVSLPDLNHSFLPLSFWLSQFPFELVNLFLRLPFSVGFRLFLFLSLPPTPLVSSELNLLVVVRSRSAGKLLFLLFFYFCFNSMPAPSLPASN